MEKSDKIIFAIIVLCVLGVLVFWKDVNAFLGGRSTNTEINVDGDKKEKKKDKKKDRDKKDDALVYSLEFISAA